MSCDGADYFAIAPTCPIPNEMSAVRGCDDAACGDYCLADGVLPDGSKKYIINNCISGGQNRSVFIRLCTGQTPAPTTEVENWVQERHRVFDCVETNLNITSPTFKTVATSSAIEDAIIECMAACQRSEICKFWTLDIKEQICALKLNKTGTAISESSFSGDGKCTEIQIQQEFWSSSHQVELTVDWGCSEKFTIEILEGDHEDEGEYMNVQVNGVYKHSCHPRNISHAILGEDPSWISCGVFDTPSSDTFAVRI
jgi:hypothetical protein